MTRDKMTISDLGWRCYEHHKRYPQIYNRIEHIKYLGGLLFFGGKRWNIYIRYKSSDEYKGPS
jgi:hypothetical protein